MRKISYFVVSLVCFTLAVLAADPAAANPVGDAVAGLLTGVVFPVLSALLLGLVGVVLNKVRQKYNLQISQQAQDNLELLAQRGIAFAEEKAAAWAKQGVTKLTGKEKLDTAIAYMMNAAPRVSSEQAEALVHVVLGKVSGAAGATGEAGVHCGHGLRSRYSANAAGRTDRRPFSGNAQWYGGCSRNRRNASRHQ